MTYAKPWETRKQREARVERETEVAQSARRKYSRAVNVTTDRRLDKNVIACVAREYAKHGDIVRALIATDFIGEDTDNATIQKMANRVRRNPAFEEAFERVVCQFSDEDILTRNRVLAGLMMEAADRSSGMTTGTSRVTAWSKLAQLMGMERDAKEPPKPAEEAHAKSGVMLIPHMGGIEEWEAAAMGQQAKLKSDVRA